jgi:hypothetical protein
LEDQKSKFEEEVKVLKKKLETESDSLKTTQKTLDEKKKFEENQNKLIRQQNEVRD